MLSLILWRNSRFHQVPRGGTMRLLRRGACRSIEVGLRVALRYIFDPTTRNFYFGFRCAAPIDNLYPYVPARPFHAINANTMSITTFLSWYGGDPDGDAVTYDTYLESQGSILGSLLL
jgi:hypothetical protein